MFLQSVLASVAKMFVESGHKVKERLTGSDVLARYCARIASDDMQTKYLADPDDLECQVSSNPYLDRQSIEHQRVLLRHLEQSIELRKQAEAAAAEEDTRPFARLTLARAGGASR